MSECELCGSSEDYCPACSTCFFCLDKEHQETINELVVSRAEACAKSAQAQAENDQLKACVDKSYDCGVADGMADSAGEIERLKARVAELEKEG